MRQKDGKQEYEYRKLPSLVPATAPAESIPTKKSAPSKSSEPSKSKSKSKSKSSKSKVTDWNEWEWSEEHKCEYRSRQKDDGEWEDEYRQKGE